MSTTFFLTSTSSTATVTGFSGTKLSLSLTRGGSAVTQTDNTIASLTGFSACPWGDTAARNINSLLGSGLIFITNPLNAVTITGQITVNSRSLESNAMANYGAACYCWTLTSSGTATVFPGAGGGGTNTTEIGTTEGASSILFTPNSTTVNAGDAIILVIAHGGSTGGTTASGFTASGFYNGPTSGASGDSFITFAETITEQVAANPAYFSSYRQLLAQ